MCPKPETRPIIKKVNIKGPDNGLSLKIASSTSNITKKKSP